MSQISDDTPRLAYSPTTTTTMDATTHSADGNANARTAGHNHFRYPSYQHPHPNLQTEFADLADLAKLASPSTVVAAAADVGTPHPGQWRPYEHRKFANPGPLGLGAFAFSTFLLSLINLHTRDVTAPNVLIPVAFAYGGIVQLLAGMWEMAVGNTLGATSLSSYGGFWLSYSLLIAPTWGITDRFAGPYADNPNQIYDVVAFFLTGWFIFTTLMLICTLRSDLVSFLLFATLDLAFLFLACENYAASMGHMAASDGLRVAGGVTGIISAFLGWYSALATLLDSNNSFFQLPTFAFPWSEKGREMRAVKNGRMVV